jgi:hypothetical protein
MSDYETMFGDPMSADDIDAVDTDTTAAGASNPTEQEQLLAELAMERVAEVREEIVAKYPALEPFVDMLAGNDEESVMKLAAELNARIGGEVVDDPHPGNADPYATLPGESALDKAKALAKDSKEYGAFFALKEAAALEAEGKVGRLLTEGDRARVKQAADFARRTGDRAAYMRLLRQLG